MAPMRIKNLASLRLGTQVLRDRRNRMTLVLVEDETKNKVPLEVALPAPTVALLNLYLSDYWPLLGGDRCNFLFPGRDAGRAKCIDALRQQIATCLLKRCGQDMHPHLFRHLAAMLILTDNPGAYGQAQRVLGHKSIDTTISFYAGMEGSAAFRHYDAMVTRLRGDAEAPPRRRRTRRQPTGQERPR